MVLKPLCLILLTVSGIFASDTGRQAVDKDEQIVKRGGGAFDFWGGGGEPFGDTFSEMRALMERMFQRGAHFGDGFFDRSGAGDSIFGGGVTGRNLKISESEDKDFKYVIVEGEGLDKDGINIKMEDGALSIFGEIRKTHTEGGHSSVSVSSFRQSVSVPHGVEESKVQFEHEKDKIVIKFPKSQSG